MYRKRTTVEKFWPVPRKGTKYLSSSTHDAHTGIPILIVLRDLLKVVRSAKEAKKILNDKKVLINNRVVKTGGYPLSLFDVVSFPTIKKYYKATLKGKKMTLEETSEKNSKTRVYRIIGKKLLKGKKVQVNLSNGRNLELSKSAEVGDF